MRPILAMVLAGVLGCSGNGSRAQEQLAQLQKKKEEDAKNKKVSKLEAPPLESVHLSEPYDEAGATVVNSDGPCPEGLWALFPGPAPGATPQEKKANEAKRAELAAQVRRQRYLVKLRGPAQVTLSTWDAASGDYHLDVIGTVDCVDTQGRIALTWTAGKAGDPGNSAAKEGAELTQRMWLAPTERFTLNIKSISEAKEFADKNRFGLSARVAFTLGKTEVDRLVKRVGKVSEKVGDETLSFGGGG